ncbi:MAG: phosphoribulokinase [Chromatiales bacterium]|jgi:phosphoribulokinase|nr:phosphoribulokinase [Chromatiales bacterium]
MSALHPVVAVTGSSGAGTSTVKTAFEHIFRRLELTAAVIEGDSFHKYDRAGMRTAVKQAEMAGTHVSHFGPEANLLRDLQSLFELYGRSGGGQRRFYIHDVDEGEARGSEPGTFTTWEDLPGETDLLFYEGLHGAMVNDDVDIAKHVDLKIGVVPIVNLEWIQKIHRDTSHRGYCERAVTSTILRRMPDYVEHIAPQFSLTDINFQRVPTVDTSNPFVARDIPTPDESFAVIRFSNPKKFNIDFPYLMSMLKGSFMSRRNTIVVPGGKMGLAIEVIVMPILEEMMVRRDELRARGAQDAA